MSWLQAIKLHGKKKADLEDHMGKRDEAGRGSQIESQCCPPHGTPCEIHIHEENNHFALSKYHQLMLSSDSKFVWSPSHTHEVQCWVMKGLRESSISRAAVDWGIPVQTDLKQIICGWFDGLLRLSWPWKPSSMKSAGQICSWKLQ